MVVKNIGESSEITQSSQGFEAKGHLSTVSGRVHPYHYFGEQLVNP